LWCWGDNTTGQLGLGLVAEADAPTPVGTAQWQEVDAGTLSTCGIQVDGTLWCWGFNNNLQTGIGSRGLYTSSDRLDGNTFYEAASPTEVGEGWKAVAEGATFGCGLKDDDSLWCWGDDTYGQLGDPNLGLVRPSPLRIGADPWSAIATGTYHTCGIKPDHTLWCWGRNDLGQVSGASANTSVPVQVVSDHGPAWSAVAAGSMTTCALTADTGAVYCWGYPHGAMPVPIMSSGQPLTGATTIAMGGEVDRGYATTACVLTGDGSLWCWGDGAFGQLGGAGGVEPVELSGEAGPWHAVGVGGRNLCAIASDDSLWCIGSDSRGQLGDGGASHRVPAPVPGTWATISTGGIDTCVIDSSGQVLCAGDNANGSLGDGTKNDARTLTPIANATPMTSISVGELAACALDGGGNAWCWGYDGYGAVGDNYAIGSQVTNPQMIAGHTFTQIAVSNQACAIDNAQQLYCWGYNQWGQVGNGSLAPVLTPVHIGSDSWSQVVVGHDHSCGVNGTGTACWGYDEYGQLGFRSVDPSTAYSSPVIVTSAFSQLTAGGYHTCGLDAGGLASCWGQGTSGQLGIAGLGDVYMPQPVGADEWTQLSGGLIHTCGIKAADSSLWCWGGNEFGQVGDGTLDARDVPVPIGPAGARWLAVSASGKHTCALRDDHTMWCWGLNDSGQLADGTAWRDVFVRIP
jgi:alpha-tubulin suppressor-like RCC1 family protein